MEPFNHQDPYSQHDPRRPPSGPPTHGYPPPPSHYSHGAQFQQPNLPPPPQQQHQVPPGVPPPQRSGIVLPMHGPPQLPPQLFTTAAQLLDLTDKKLVLILRDGRKLIGVLRSWDQFANLVFQDTIERIYANGLYGDRPCGVYIVRGENVLLLGEIDLDKEDDMPTHYRRAPWEEVAKYKEEEESKQKEINKRRSGKLQTLGFEAEHSGEVLFG